MFAAGSFKGKRVAVFGLARSGTALIEALRLGGAEVIGWDDSGASVAKAETAGLPVADLRPMDFAKFDALVLSPGVPLTHPEPHWTVKKAQAAGIEIIGDIELFCRERRARCPEAALIAITGTNGKSTTTALIAHILNEAGKDVQIGGNIGVPILELKDFEPQKVYVIECSSYQIDLAPSIDPTVGVLLNITPDHLDRHGTIETYAAVKERLVANSVVSVVGVDDDYSRAIADRIYAKKGFAGETIGYGPGLIPISAKGKLPYGVYFEDDAIFKAELNVENRVVQLRGIAPLRGAHNGQNAAAAFATCRALGCADNFPARIKKFQGLQHRLETVRRYGPVDFVNDSKATNAESTEKALASWNSGIYLILGGKAKAGGIEALRPYFSRIEKAYLIGDATDEFAATLNGAVSYERCGTLDVAVHRATTDALAANKPETVVLLSPACASFDQYKNFEVRGDHFRQLVLAEIERRGGQ